MLDTNVVLDWFVFRNPGVAPLVQAIESGRLHWLSCAEMQAELAHVLAHGSFGGRLVDAEQVLTSSRTHCTWAALSNGLPAHRLRCSDVSDQMFIDLALEHGADWLLTRDRALLRLARKVALRGLRIGPPEAWIADFDASVPGAP